MSIEILSKIKNFIKLNFPNMVIFSLKLFHFLSKEANITNLYLKKKNKYKLRNLKNTHKGQRCFIIGNGPSLTSKDLDLLKNEICFAANRIYCIYNETEWRPTYYCSQDLTVIKGIDKDIENAIKPCKNAFFVNSSYNILPHNIFNLPKVIFFYPHLCELRRKRSFSSQIERYIDGGGTVTYSAIQIAAYMGFKEIYLLGVDHNYPLTNKTDINNLTDDEIRKCYFKGMSSNIKLNIPNTDRSTLSYLAAKDYCEANNIKIYNATRGGKLEVFKRISLEEALL